MKTNKLKTGFISARVNSFTDDFFKGYKLQSSGSVASLVLDAFPTLYQVTVNKIKKLFTEQELIAIVSTGNGYAITPGMVPDFWWHISESIKYDLLDQQFEIDKDQILEKAKSLSLPESFIVELWANTFWYGGGMENDKKDIYKYIKEESNG